MNFLEAHTIDSLVFSQKYSRIIRINYVKIEDIIISKLDELCNKLNSKKFLTKPWFKKIKNLVHEHTYWNNYLHSFDSWNEFPHGIHLSIFVEPYLTHVLNGKKTVESRFSINRSPPYKKVQSKDILFLKVSGGPIVGICQVTNIRSYELDPKLLRRIKKDFTDSLCVQDPKFWDDRQSACYATLMKISNPVTFEPFTIEKKDRRGWVVLRAKDQLTCISSRYGV